MNNLLVFFAIPVATIILSAILQTFVNCPLKIAGITFSILLIVAYSSFDSSFLIFVILYTLLSYITAWIVNQINNRQNNLQTIENLINESNISNTEIETLQSTPYQHTCYRR